MRAERTDWHVSKREGKGTEGAPKGQGQPGGACPPTPTSSMTPTGILVPRNGPSIRNPRAYLQSKGSISILKGCDAKVGGAGMGWLSILAGGQIS